MLTFPLTKYRSCDGINRRGFFQIGALGLGGLTLADVLRLRAAGEPRRAKSVIMIYLPGGPSHIDMYDLKPQAMPEVRGEFKPIATNVPGTQICELMPLQARIADKFSVVNGILSVDIHSPELLMRGTLEGAVKRPVFGSVVSKLRGAGPLPPYVTLGYDIGDPTYLGAAHKPFGFGRQEGQNLGLPDGVSRARLADRQGLWKAFDTLNREADTRAGDVAGMDAFQTRALDMITSGKAREAIDISKEPQRLRDLYGEAGATFLMARRLVEAGVSVVTTSANFYRGDWDTHGVQQAGEPNGFQNLRGKLPPYDRCVHTLITDLCERGLDQDVAVVIWGEFGRAPKINEIAGRHHWPMAGAALLAGGGLRMGQVVGDTGPRGERDRSRPTPYTPSNVLSTLYHVLGIDPETTLPDFSGRPQYLLDDRKPIQELI